MKRLLAVGRWSNGRWEVTAGQGTLPDNVREYLRRLETEPVDVAELERKLQSSPQPVKFQEKK